MKILIVIFYVGFLVILGNFGYEIVQILKDKSLEGLYPLGNEI